MDDLTTITTPEAIGEGRYLWRVPEGWMPVRMRMGKGRGSPESEAKGRWINPAGAA